VTDRDQATLPDSDAQADEPDVDATAMPDPTEPVEPGESGLEPTAETPGEPEPEPSPEPDYLEWAEATAAFVLGVLPADDAAAAALEIARSRQLQAEVAALLPVADILLSLYQTQPAPSPAAVTAPVAAPPVTERRPAEPARRIAQPRTQSSARPAMPSLGGRNASLILIAALAAAAVIGLLWALALNDRVATKTEEIDALKRQVTQLRQAANASTFVLAPSSDAPDGARGTVFYSLADSTVIIDVSGLPGLDQDHVYQVWFQQSGSADWQPGPTFLVNAQGEAVQRLPGQTPTFARIAISEEPAPGSSAPSTPVLLEGALSGGNG
jgi:hypothetical protein